MNLNKVYQIEVNRSQLLDVLAMHLHAMGIAPKSEINIIDILGLPTTEMVKVRYKKEEQVTPVMTVAV
jgi:hypothetical protein